jgi:photosystem II stability/assembly factor-like uncharacterized protein
MSLTNQLLGLGMILLMAISFPNPNITAQEAAANPLFKDLTFRNIGPTRGGRATTVTGIHDKPGTFFQGSTGGGLWMTTDYGHNWKNVSDGYFATSSMGAIRAAHSNTDIIYVGTGSDGIRSNVITGKGVYKSTDGGKSWSHVGLENTGQIGAIEIHPEDPNTVYVAAIGNAFAPNPERGVYRTTDGGQSWEKILFVSDKTGAVDLEFAPDDPNTIYACMWRGERKPWTIISGGKEGGIYKTTDGGNNWNQLTNGLPSDPFGKSDLAVSADAPNRVYALVEAPEDEKKGGLYVSSDRGETFTLVSTYRPLLDRPFYYCNVDADPNNADVLYVNATQFFRSADGGKKWTRMRTPHGDNHDIWIHPDDSNLWVQCNDGGANVTRDGGKTWSTQHNQSTAELYQVEVDDQFPYQLYAGQQDNSTIMLPSHPPYGPASGATGFWMAVGGCETGPVVPKPGNPDIVYANCKGRFGVYNKKTGQEKQYYVGASNMYGHNPKDLKFRFQRVSPIHVSSHNPDVVYHTSQYVHKTTDDGQTWEIISPDLTAFEADKQVISGSPITRDITGEEFYSTIYAIQESKLKEGLIWVGANDGPVHVTKDGGENWMKVTPEAFKNGGRVDAVEPSPHDEAKAYVAGYRYQLGDWKPYIFKTEDYGQNWTLLTPGDNGIPADFPIRVVREDPSREGLLYAGTEFGLFVSMDDGKNWLPFQQNLPVTPITDIKVNQKDLVMSTMGRGFWILDDVTPLHQVNETIAGMDMYLFKPRDSHRMRYRRTSSSSIPYYPGASVLIHYHLKDSVKSEIVLDILDEDQKVIRSFSNQKGQDNRDNIPEPAMSTGFFMQGFNAQLKSEPGLHRVSWDMRHLGPWRTRGAGSGGPMVAPGTYYAKLKVGDRESTVQFRILGDPRVLESGVSLEDMQAQEALTLQIRDLATQANRMAAEVEKEHKEISKATEDSEEADGKMQQRLNKLNKLKNALITKEGRYTQPMIVDQIRYLGSMLGRADQMPGKDAYDRYKELKEAVEKLVPDYKALFQEKESE